MRKGEKMTKESREKMSKVKMGNKNALGYKHKKETKQKISKALTGRVVSDETRKKESLLRKGEKHYNWKGGITNNNNKIRNSEEYRLWRKSCFERDNFTCQKTGVSGGKLIVHHINNFADFPELRFAIDNGITLSEEAHIRFHKLYGRSNNTKEQLEEFLNNI